MLSIPKAEIKTDFWTKEPDGHGDQTREMDLNERISFDHLAAKWRKLKVPDGLLLLPFVLYL